MSTDPLKRNLDRDRKQLAEALDQTIEDTIRESWLPNTVAWVATVAGAFLVNLVLLVLVTGRV